MNLYKGINSGEKRIKIVIIKAFFGLEGSWTWEMIWAKKG